MNLEGNVTLQQTPGPCAGDDVLCGNWVEECVGSISHSSHISTQEMKDPEEVCVESGLWITSDRQETQNH